MRRYNVHRKVQGTPPINVAILFQEKGINKKRKVHLINCYVLGTFLTSAKISLEIYQ
jgi:hypothetical protein